MSSHGAKENTHGSNARALAVSRDYLATNKLNSPSPRGTRDKSTPSYQE